MTNKLQISIDILLRFGAYTTIGTVGKRGVHHTTLIPNTQNYIEEKVAGVFRP